MAEWENTPPNICLFFFAVPDGRRWCVFWSPTRRGQTWVFPGPRFPVKEPHWQNMPCASHTPHPLCIEGKSWSSGRMALSLHCMRPDGSVGLDMFVQACMICYLRVWMFFSMCLKGESVVKRTYLKMQRFLLHAVGINIMLSKLLKGLCWPLDKMNSSWIKTSEA